MNEKNESRSDGEEKADGAGTLQHYTRLKRIICAGSESGQECTQMDT